MIFPVFDTYKVKVAGENDSLFQKKDEVPEFLSEKIKTDRAENISNTSAWPGNAGGPLPGYIFKQAVDGEQGDPSYMFLRWDYPQISGWNNADYLQLNSREGALKW